ncbi:MAG TPA: TolC family protein [Flavobacteriales bacterium]|nr:TolC family protein [Flavobacteriales bacterium]
MRSIAIIISLAMATTMAAQGPVSLSLQQALDLAAKQSYAVQASELEAEKSRAKVKEITAIGLPQINGEVQLQNFIDVPTQLIPNFFSPPGTGGPEFIAAQFGLPWNASAGATLSQLIFDGSYIIGLKATRAVAEQSQQELEKAAADARNQAAKAYFGVLSAEEGARLAGEGIPLLEKSLVEVGAMRDAGFMESIDVDRITIQLEQAKTLQRSFQQQASVARMMLALALGIPQGTPITLTDDLDKILSDPNETALSEMALEPANHIEQQVAENIVLLSDLQRKNERSKALPSLGGFLSHQQVWNGPDFDPGGKYQFYPTTLWGLKLTVPIFSSTSRIQKVKQASLALKQAEVNRTATTERLKVFAEQSRTQARTAFDNFKTEERSMALAKSIFDRTSIKFTEGAAASFELTQEQGNYLMAQQTYIQRVVELLMARADLRKALDLY